MGETKTLLIGSGAREHSIAQALHRSGARVSVLMDYLNPGIRKVSKESGGEIFLGDTNDPGRAVEVSKKVNPEFVFIGPEEPLFRGVSDRLIEEGFHVIGPPKELAMIEMSKVYMRRLQEKYSIPGRLRFKPFKSERELEEFLKEYEEVIDASVALKPARQAGGKGVKVIADQKVFLRKEARELEVKHGKRIIEEGLSGELEEKFFLEERGYGVEYTLQVFSDGEHVLPLPVVHDHPHYCPDFMGSECGGMGSVMGPGMDYGIEDKLPRRGKWVLQENYLTPFINGWEYDRTVEIIQKTIEAMEKETGEKYKGVISGQMMLTPYWGPTVLEYYSRLGDPEAVNVLPIVENLLEVCEALIDEKLNRVKLEIENKATVVKCFAPRGYPDHRREGKGKELLINESEIEKRGVRVYYGSIYLDSGKMLTGGSRAVELFSKGDFIEECSSRIERVTEYLSLRNWELFHRPEIGSENAMRIMAEEAQKAKWRYQRLLKEGRLGEERVSWLPRKGKVEVFSS